MLQLTNGSIVEMPLTTTGMVEVQSCNITVGGGYPLSYPNGNYYTIWQSYPVYVCSDKTAKAIEILKVLQAEKKIECKSVPKFIELVEKIAGLL